MSTVGAVEAHIKEAATTIREMLGQMYATPTSAPFPASACVAVVEKLETLALNWYRQALREHRNAEYWRDRVRDAGV